MNLEDIKRAGRDAAELKGNKLLMAAFQAVRDSLESKSLSTPATDEKACQDIIRTRQILAGVERFIQSTIDDGKIAERELARINEGPKKRIFSRS